jgi:hypothetical protein
VFREKLAVNGRPTVVTVAFWCQLAVAMLLVVVVGVATARDLCTTYSFDAVSAQARGSLLFSALVLALAAWLAIFAFGLRRRGRLAYRLSLAGLALPLPGGVAATVFGLGSTNVAYFRFSPGDAASAEGFDQWLNTWEMLSRVVNASAVAMLVLVVTTIGVLLTGPSRRYFRT